MNGLIGKKIGMTSIFNSEGKNIACTVVEALPNVVTQVKTIATDGYNALQLGYGDVKDKSTTKQMLGHFENAKTTPKRKVVEFRDFEIEKGLGDEINAEEVFQEGDYVNAIGTSKGKGFQGVVKRHGFGGVGDATHGQHNRLRAPGSIGAGSTPSRVYKGMRMAGQYGNKRTKITNLEVLKLIPEKHVLLIKGAIPGSKGSLVIIEK